VTWHKESWLERIKQAFLKLDRKPEHKPFWNLQRASRFVRDPAQKNYEGSKRPHAAAALAVTSTWQSTRRASLTHPGGALRALHPARLAIQPGERGCDYLALRSGQDTPATGLLSTGYRPQPAAARCLTPTPTIISGALRRLRTRIGLSIKPALRRATRVITGGTAGRLGQWSSGPALYFQLCYPLDIPGAREELEPPGSGEKLFAVVISYPAANCKTFGIARGSIRAPTLLLAMSPVSAMDPPWLTHTLAPASTGWPRASRKPWLASLHAVDLALRLSLGLSLAWRRSAGSTATAAQVLEDLRELYRHEGLIEHYCDKLSANPAAGHSAPRCL